MKKRLNKAPGETFYGVDKPMGMHERLDERHEQVLGAVIHAYVTLAKPVGSGTLVRRYSLGVSSATVRTIMADLERMGYLNRWHVSSGRIPTDAGYRYYVDLLLDIEPLTSGQKNRIDAEYRTEPVELESVLERTSRRLAFESRCAGVVKGPLAGRRWLAQIKLVQLAPAKLLVVLIDNLDTVRNYTVNLSGKLSRSQVERMSERFNALLNAPVAGGAVSRSISRQLKRLRTELDSRSCQASEILGGLPTRGFDGKIYVEGTRSVLDQPEFRDPAMTRAILDVLTEDDKLSLLLQRFRNDSQGVTFLIGSDVAMASVAGISVVAARYSIGERPVGTLAIIGPIRMHYSRAASLVNYTAEALSEALTDTFGSTLKEKSVN